MFICNLSATNVQTNQKGSKGSMTLQSTALSPAQAADRGWRVYFLRYPLALWLLYAITAYTLLTALQSLWAGFDLRLQTGQWLLAADTADPWYELGTSFGFWGMLFMGLNFILAARWSWVEDLLGGLDHAYQAHALVGKAALVFLLVHLGVLAVQALPDQQVLAQYLLPLVDIRYTLGMVGVLLLLLLVALTLWVRMPYERWLRTHQWMGVAYVAGSLHAILLQTDWYLILIMSVGSYAWLYRLVFYRWWERQSAGVLADVAPKGDVTELSIALDQPFPARAGQFVFMRVSESAARLPAEPHPFSISAVLDDRTVRISAKALGDFTRQLPRLQVGDRVHLSGPYGRFGARRQLAQGPLLWVAGGIGVTPFLSLLRQEQAQPGPAAPVTLIWSVRNRQEAVYLGEIERAVAELPHVQFHLHVSNEAGYLTAARLDELHQPSRLAASTVFLCGPPAMMKSLSAQCRQLGLPRNSLVMEEFAMR